MEKEIKRVATLSEILTKAILEAKFENVPLEDFEILADIKL
jgi:hypothetical protein